MYSINYIERVNGEDERNKLILIGAAYMKKNNTSEDYFLYSLVVGFAISIVLIITVSLLTKAPSE